MTTDDQPYPWVSRNGFMEARLFGESAEEVTYFFRSIGAQARGVAKSINKEEFEKWWRLKVPAPEQSARCNMCGWNGEEADLIAVKDSQDGEYTNCACPICKTDHFIADFE